MGALVSLNPQSFYSHRFSRGILQVLSSNKPREYLTFVHKTDLSNGQRGTQLHVTGGKAKASRTPKPPWSLGENSDRPSSAGSQLGVT